MTCEVMMFNAVRTHPQASRDGKAGSQAARGAAAELEKELPRTGTTLPALARLQERLRERRQERLEKRLQKHGSEPYLPAPIAAYTRRSS